MTSVHATPQLGCVHDHVRDDHDHTDRQADL
jgi:hypothetical protein